MRNALSALALLSAALPATGAFAAQSMTVAVCNQGQLPDAVVRRAEDEAAYVFRSADVEIHWTGCGAEIALADAHTRPDFIVRVRQGQDFEKVGPVSLEAMGRAFLDGTGDGYLADAYYGAIRQLTLSYPIAGADRVLGCTIAHELGHLLLGPGHRLNGIMQAAWTDEELVNLNQRRFKFNTWERAAIARKLALRK